MGDLEDGGGLLVDVDDPGAAYRLVVGVGAGDEAAGDGGAQAAPAAVAVAGGVGAVERGHGVLPFVVRSG